MGGIVPDVGDNSNERLCCTVGDELAEWVCEVAVKECRFCWALVEAFRGEGGKDAAALAAAVFGVGG